MNAMTSTSGTAINGALLPEVTKGMVFTLRGVTFRVTQVIAESNAVYLEQKRESGKWDGFDRGGNLRALQAALASEYPLLTPELSRCAAAEHEPRSSHEAQSA